MMPVFAMSLASAAAESLSRAEQERIRTLYTAHYDVVWRVLRRNGLGAAQADDGAQQVFLIAAQRLSDLVEGKERAFLCSTALWVGRRIKETGGREQLLEVVPDVDSGQRPDEEAERRRRRALLDRVLGKLADELRAVLILQDVEGLSKSEAAVALGVPEGTVASRLRRAREAFQAELANTLGAAR
jgi:RNA polymerase sigma-70 factor, ECF subfamily